MHTHIHLAPRSLNNPIYETRAHNPERVLARNRTKGQKTRVAPRTQFFPNTTRHKLSPRSHSCCWRPPENGAVTFWGLPAPDPIYRSIYTRPTRRCPFARSGNYYTYVVCTCAELRKTLRRTSGGNSIPPAHSAYKVVLFCDF